MKHGDFTNLAQYYKFRPNYSELVLEYIRDHINKDLGNLERIADVGAGTGKLTENLIKLGLQGYAVEPNDAMRHEGMEYMKNEAGIIWVEGKAECTNLEDNSVDWVLMGSSFHWTQYEEAMKEFYRILKPGGYFSAIWNPRNIRSSELHMKIEACIYDELPNMKRVSSGSTVDMNEMRMKMLTGNLFGNLIYIEAEHSEVMNKERYMNIWKSVNDIRVQAGEERFQTILLNIEELIKDQEMILVPYLSRAWTVKSKKQEE